MTAAVLSACGSDEQALVSEKAHQSQPTSQPMAQQNAARQSAAAPSTRGEDVDGTSAPRAEPAAEDVRELDPPAETSAAGGGGQEVEGARAETSAVSHQSEDEEAEPEPEEPPRHLTGVPATVTLDADVRIRPGLVWRVIDRLESGASVVVLQQIESWYRPEGWYRIRYGDEHDGWVPKWSLDSGDINSSRVLSRPAPALIAEWQSERYGVLGRTADGAQVRLLNGSAEILDAPISEVRLVDADAMLEELPILIGDETVVFPGDDFRVGQGRILPKANEYLWLDDGTLLAHNDSDLWRWNSETDELRLTPRPPGLADLSPDGQSLGIAICGGEESCHPYLDVTIMPLDGSPAVSLLASLEGEAASDHVNAIDLHSYWLNPANLDWSPDGSALLLSIQPADGIVHLTSIVFERSGRTTVLDPTLDGWNVEEGCETSPSRGLSVFWRWYRNTSDRVAMSILCDFADDRRSGYQAIVWVGGESNKRELADLTYSVALGATRAGINSLGPVEADRLGDNASEYGVMSGPDQYGIVVAPDSRQWFVFDRFELQVRPVIGSGEWLPDWLWDQLKLGYEHMDLYWSTDRHVAIIARPNLTPVVAGLLVDLDAASAVPIEIGSARHWPCYPSGGWSPDGSVFQVEFEGYSSYQGLEDVWIDGTAKATVTIAQRQFLSSTGEAIAVLRAVTTGRSLVPLHLGRWSNDGRWFAIGGHQETTHCIFGP
ncbi:MAG: hypothetical protein F4W96_09750 [Chloroflexi bacterium]|nr:hypothetical protein [Chloroflexota bacterium]